MPLALAVLVLAALWRLLAPVAPATANFAPLMALTFCSAVYFRDPRLWLAPLGALVVSDLWLDHYYATTWGYSWNWPSAAVRALCFVAALPLGRFVAARKGWRTLFGGALSASLIFYLVTNTDAWLRDPGYPGTWAGWIQAMTLGLPGFPPTLFFFRQTLLSDLGFTALFAGALELAAFRAGRPSLLGQTDSR